MKINIIKLIVIIIVMTYELYNSDCFDVLPELEENSIDCVIVDLPYGQTAMNWDSAIDLDKMWLELKRICKPNTNYVFFTTTKYGIELINSNRKWFRYDLIWSKSRKVGFMSSGKMPLRQHEMIYLFGKPSEKKYYKAQKTEGKAYKTGDVKNSNNVYGITTKGRMVEGRHPTSILEYKNPSKPVHRTQKPVDLLDFLVLSYSQKNQTILDFTAGSGTTGISAVKNGRNFIGIERDEEIFKIMSERLKNP